MKYGALVGLVLAGASLLGAFSPTGEGSHIVQAAPVQAVSDLAEASKPTPIAAVSPAESSDPGVIVLSEAERLQLASNTTRTIAVSEMMMGQAALKQAGCGDITLSIRPTATSATPNSTIGFLSSSEIVPLGSNNLPRTVEIEWYLPTDADAVIVAGQFTGKPQLANPANPLSSVNIFNQTYPDEGSFDVGMRIRIERGDGTRFYCPPLGNDPFIIPNLISISTVNTASFNATSLVQDNQAIPPLSDWVPLAAISLGYNPDQFAPRALGTMTYRLVPDPEPVADTITSAPEYYQILEFGIFRDVGPDGPDQTLQRNPFQPFYDGSKPFLQWDAQGYPYEYRIDQDINEPFYRLSFVYDPLGLNFDSTNPLNVQNPQLPYFDRDDVENDGTIFDINNEVVGVTDTDGDGRSINWITAGPDPNNGYILAFRTSAGWKSGTTLGIEILDAKMVPYSIDEQPLDPNTLDPLRVNVGLPVGDDSYSPNFSEGEILEAGGGYSSAFTIWDIRSPSSYIPYPANDWNWPAVQYTPNAEFTRPRWDIGEAFLERTFGEVMDLRDLFSIEEFLPVIGMDMHGSPSDQPVEINVVVTDIGGDPYAPPGNGGFNAKEGLEKSTILRSPIVENAFGLDYTFNGMWLWHDTNNNGVFDPPAQSGVGVTYSGDYPMIPEYPAGSAGFAVAGVNEWEYVPFPPGGGDPWWKIRLRFDGGRRRADFETTPTGFFEPVPEGLRPSDGKPVMDYFLVMRADSGYRDSSGLSGDGNSIAFGADMRVFIEPRRWNTRGNNNENPDLVPVRAHWDGGLLTSDMYPGTNLGSSFGTGDSPYWQDDPSINTVCYFNEYPCEADRGFTAPQPFWTEAYSERGIAKPIKTGLEVHDLVLTYSTNNNYGKETLITEGQLNATIDQLELSSFLAAWNRFQDPPIVPIPDLVTNEVTLHGIMRLRLPGLRNFTVYPDRTSGLDDERTRAQYAYETVPFKLNAGTATDSLLRDPRSPYFPNPPLQPTLPSYATWPPAEPVIAFGAQSYCYLQSEGAIPNIPYNDPAPTPPNGVSAEKSYEDDVYVFVAEDCQNCNADYSGYFIIDRNNHKFRIISNSGNAFTLDRGHGAYLDQFFRFSGGEVSLPDWPFGISVGLDGAVDRGPWFLTKDVIRRDNFSRQSDWPEGLEQDGGTRAARLLKQHINASSQPTAMLGINVVGSDDTVVNSFADVGLNSITVAFWGPEFSPRDFASLDPNGALVSSGVALYEDTNNNGVFNGPRFFDLTPVAAFTDRIVPLEPSSLQWRREPEPIDIDGDFIADDMSGDGFVALTQSDVETLRATEPDFDGLLDTAWVLRLQPGAKWQIPRTDPEVSQSLLPGLKSLLQPSAPDYWSTKPMIFEWTPEDEVAANDKALPLAGSPGDDLFVVVRTSDTIGQFAQFRCVIPSKLPNRTPVAERVAGIEFSPIAYPVVQSFIKTNPEEEIVQDFYGHDMLEVSVPARIEDFSRDLLSPTLGVPVVGPGREVASVLGIDVSANRPANQVAEGTGGSVSGNVFTTGNVVAPVGSKFFVDGAWTGETVGCYVVAMGNDAVVTDRRLEAFEITAVAGKDLTLRAGLPAVDSVDSKWHIIKDPTFLEQVVVEFYDASADGNFDLQNDFAPLDFEDPINGQFSGVALYRDNDLDPRNTNGKFDPPVRDANGTVIDYIDLPVRLDDPPILIGIPGEPEYQVKFVFSSPGTDNLIGRDEMAYELQPRLRQWVPQTFGQVPDDLNFGSDFFVVVRPSLNMSQGDDFTAAIVSWGPDTPTAPDPDNFSRSLTAGQLPGQQANEFDLFEEFPWGSRGLGFITFFRDPRPHYYWTYDQDNRKTITTQEVDHSQDDKDIRYWVRSNTAISGRTLPITALPPFKIDFTVDRNRQIPGGDVVFTLVTDGAVRDVEWDFGDGTTSTERNPVHQYARTGVYTVRLTARDVFGVEAVVEKEDIISIFNAPFADFDGNPKVGNITPDPNGVAPPGLNVSFVDLSVGSDEFMAVNYFWNFGDGESLQTTERATVDKPLVHRYTAEGVFDVTLAVTFRNVNTNATTVKICALEDLITVRACVGCSEGEGEGEGGGGGEDPPAAAFNPTIIIKDKEALVPLTDWVPLFNFTMSYGEDDPAPRFLRRLVYDIRPDQRDPNDLNYANFGGPAASDLLEFGLFVERNDCDCETGTLDAENDYLLYKWDNRGAPLGVLTNESRFSGLRYDLDFVGNGTAGAPQFPVEAGAETEDDDDGESYIVAMRTSATWRSQLTANVVVQAAEMIIPTSGSFPVNDDGEPVDDYPEFPVEADSAYSSSFTVWDVTGSPAGVNSSGFFDAWNYTGFLYTPLAEHTRPKWNQPNRILDIIAGEFIELRNLVSLDTWTPVIGINLHSTKPEHFFDSVGSIRFEESKGTLLREVNLVMTDIGADPNGAPGNGGFNPTTGLERMTESVWGAPIDAGEAFAADFSYNGIWVWHDTNGDGVFQGPEINAATGGITFPGDKPLLPSSFNGVFQDSFTPWEWIATPPGGGDPWWKIRLRFFSGERRSIAEIIDPANVAGFVEPVPDNVVPAFSGSEYTNDFFVVVRTDSGFKDASLGAPDNTGISMGADFRTFVEPRRFNTQTGSEDGGIYVDSMIPSLYPLSGTWQDDARWGSVEPWFSERTVNSLSTKPVKVGLEVHDLVLTYESDSQFRVFTDLFFGDGSFHETGCLGFSDGFGDPTDFGFWTDPFGLARARFLDGHSPGVSRWRLFGQEVININPVGGPADTIILAYDDTNSRGQFAYETVPFRQSALPENLRSAAYPNPPLQPTLPQYSNWSKELLPDELPRASQWTPENSAARLLTQKGDINGVQTPLLGINTVGSADPFVNDGGNEITMTQMTVAFWGPNFTPSDLAALDPTGLNPNSGVMLWEDANGDGVFLDSSLLETYLESPTPIFGDDAPVTLRNLSWRSAPEPIDLDGDGAPDDMNGDGLVGTEDYAWVLTFTPAVLWEVPHEDGFQFDFNGAVIECGSIDFSKRGALLEVPVPAGNREELTTNLGGQGPLKALNVDVVQPGDDLFVTIKTSDKAQRFEKIRAVIPATLPARDESERKAGVQFFPQVNTSASAFTKSNPDEDPVQDFYGHDMLEINVPVKIVDMTNQNQSITIGGAALPVFGLDLSTNRGEAVGTVASGTAGAGSNAAFTVADATWTANAYAGDWLIDVNYEPFQILSNTDKQLTLLSGTPANGTWRVVREPSFLEQVVVEFYNEGQDSDFNPRADLLPLKRDLEISGVALYRDNDNHPENQNGVFQPDIDIPITLDAPPVYIGQAGEDTQVKFVFSTPGTDGIGAAFLDPDTGQLVPAPNSEMANQPRNRQWVPDTFGNNSSSAFFGPDIFVVVRAAHAMNENDNFRMGLVSWGPNTPSEPDPDTWANINSESRNEFAQFREFPWAVRGLGFITFFKTPPVHYFMDGAVAGAREDASGLNWIRSHSSQKRRSGVITAKNRAVGPFSVVIDAVTPNQVPSQTLPGVPFNVVIRGQGFGTSPTVNLSGYEVTVRSATDTTISIDISTEAGSTPTEPIVLIVRNPARNESDSRSDLFTLVAGNAAKKPVVSGVKPSRGTEHDFPVEVRGLNFATDGNMQVLFGKTLMQIISVRPDGTGVSVGYPIGGLPAPGPLDVMVRNTGDRDNNPNNDPQDVMLNGFTFVNDANRPAKTGFFGCGPTEATQGSGLGDLLVLAGVAGMLLFVSRRRATGRG